MKARAHKNASVGDLIIAELQKAPVPTDPMAEQPPKQKRVQRRDRNTSTPAVVSSDNGKPRIRYNNPRVARYLARVIISRAMDFEDAVRFVGEGKFDAESIRTIAANLEKSPEVQSYIQEELSVHGLDDKSKEAFVREMWDWLRGENEELAKRAAGILGRGFIAERIIADKPEELPYAGLGAAVDNMLGKSNVQPDAPGPGTKSPLAN